MELCPLAPFMSHRQSNRTSSVQDGKHLFKLLFGVTQETLKTMCYRCLWSPLRTQGKILFLKGKEGSLGIVLCFINIRVYAQ